MKTIEIDVIEVEEIPPMLLELRNAMLKLMRPSEIQTMGGPINSPNSWTKGCNFRGKLGQHLSMDLLHNMKATECCCMWGALYFGRNPDYETSVVRPRDPNPALSNLIALVILDIEEQNPEWRRFNNGADTITSFNDDHRRTFEEVMQALKLTELILEQHYDEKKDYHFPKSTGSTLLVNVEAGQ